MSKQSFSNLFNTIEKNNYNDKRITFVSVDSKNQKTKNNYEVELNNSFSNVMSIRLKQIQFPNSLKPINQYNNKLRIILPNEKTYYNQGGCNPLNKNTKIDPYKNTTFIPDDKEYMIEIPEGFYTVEGLKEIIEEKLNIIQNKYYQWNILPLPKGEPTLQDSLLLQFSVNINPITYETKFINFIEQVNIATIQTCLHFTDNKLIKHFHHSSSYQPINRPDCVYITYGINKTQFENTAMSDLYQILSHNYLPLIVKNISNIGGIPSSLINDREYYYKPYKVNTKLYPPFLYDYSYLPGGEDYKGPTYNIVFPISSTQQYPLMCNCLNTTHPSQLTSLYNYLFFIELRITDLINKEPVNAKYNETLITDEFYKESVFEYEYDTTASILKSNKLKLNLQQILGNFNLIKELPFFGRGYFFDFVLDKDKNDDGSFNSVLFNLGWKIDCNTIHVSDTCAYKTIHSNLDFQVKDKVNFFISSDTFVKPIFPDNYFIFQN